MLYKKLGFLLPGKTSIVEQIDADRPRYQEALEDADMAWKDSTLDIGKMEAMVGDYLAIQLRDPE